jgi:hypothetical protein
MRSTFCFTKFSRRPLNSSYFFLKIEIKKQQKNILFYAFNQVETKALYIYTHLLHIPSLLLQRRHELSTILKQQALQVRYALLERDLYSIRTPREKICCQSRDIHSDEGGHIFCNKTGPSWSLP